jgi:hypothetical protein
MECVCNKPLMLHCCCLRTHQGLRGGRRNSGVLQGEVAWGLGVGQRLGMATAIPMRHGSCWLVPCAGGGNHVRALTTELYRLCLNIRGAMVFFWGV